MIDLARQVILVLCEPWKNLIRPGAIALLPMDIEGLNNLRLGLFKTMIDSVMPEIAFS